MKEMIAGAITAFLALFGVHQPSTTVTISPPITPQHKQVAAAALTLVSDISNTNSASPSSGAAPIQTPATPTIVNTYVTNPVVERVVPAPQPDEYVTWGELGALLASFRPDVLTQNAVASQQVAANGNPTYPYAASNAINNLANVTVSNPTITGGSITASSITGTISNAIDAAVAAVTSLTGTQLTYTRAMFEDATTTNLFAETASFATASTTALTAHATSTLAGIRLSNADCSAFGNGGKLTTDAFGNVYCSDDYASSGGSGNPGGLSAQIQFNDAGAFGGDAGLTYNKAGDRLTVVNASTTNLSASALFATTWNGYTPADLIAAGFSTSSATFWKSQNDFFSTTSAAFWESQQVRWATSSSNFWLDTKTTANLAEGANLYYTNARTDARIAAGIAGTTTDALGQGAVNKYYSSLLFASDLAATTTDAIDEGSANLYWTASRFNTSFGGKTTSNLAEGANLYWTNIRFDNRLSATTSLPNITTLGNLSTVSTALTGFLKATAGALSTALVNLASDVAGILPVSNGGTGWSNLASGAVLIGNGSGAVGTTTRGNLTETGSSILTITGGSSAVLGSGSTIQVAQVNGSTNGFLSSADWTTFNNKQAALGFTPANSARLVSTAYPLLGGGDLSADRTLSIAFGTTTSNTWSALQVFIAGASTTNQSVFGSLWVGGSATTTIFGSATSTFGAGIQATTISLTGAATSSAANGFNIANGCFAINGSCVSGTGGISGTVSSGTQGQFAFYNANGTTVSGTSTLFVSQAGNVGIGTTTPAELLHIAGDNDFTGSTNSDSQLRISGASDPNQRLLVGFNTTSNFGYLQATKLGVGFKSLILNPLGGNVGIGTAAPAQILDVEGTSDRQIRLRDTVTSAGKYWEIGPDAGNTFTVFNQAGSGVYMGDGGTSWISTSDQRLKTNIQTLPAASGLSAIMKLEPVTFNWKDARNASSEHLGFIAQDLQKSFPELVSTIGTTTIQHADGSTEVVTNTLGVDYSNLVVPTIKAIQDIATLADAFKTKLVAWFADAANGIEDFFATRGHFKDQLCVGDTCVTPEQFEAMVAAANGASAGRSGASSAESSPAQSSTTTPPVVEISGEKPAVIQVGSIYADLGAVITGPTDADKKLSLTLYLDGVLSPTSINLDTSVVGEHEIDYVASNAAGTATSTRRVIVEPTSSADGVAATSTQTAL